MKPIPIRPAFSTQATQLAFVVLLVFCLASPWLLLIWGAPSREDIYTTVPREAGDFGFIQRQIFAETEDIDILFLGSSIMQSAIDTPYFKEQLSTAIGREANVLTLASNWRSEDIIYVMLRDLLSRRKVRMLVLSMPSYKDVHSGPHQQSFRWLRFGDYPDVFAQLEWRDKVALYASFVYGVPRQVLSKIRPNRSWRSSALDSRFGYLGARLGFMGAAFESIDSRVPKVISEQITFTKQDISPIRKSGPPLGHYQVFFIEQLANLIGEKKIKTVLLNIPMRSQANLDYLPERGNYFDVFGAISYVGIPARKLFSRYTEGDRQIDKLFYDDHLNINGARLYTQTMAPVLIKEFINSANY